MDVYLQFSEECIPGLLYCYVHAWCHPIFMVRIIVDSLQVRLVLGLRLVLMNSSLDVGIGARDADALLGETHLVRKGAVRHPLSAVTSITLLHHLVDLLQTQALCLRNKEVSEGQ